MSVSVNGKEELSRVARSLAQHRILNREDSLDLLSAISAAQCMAYSLTYGTQPGLELGNREVLNWEGDTLTPASTAYSLRMMHYNAYSNGGTECLPVKYLERFHAVMWQLCEKVMRDRYQE